MTLVELLVVAAITVTLLAISVPMFKPMLESRRTFNAAQVLAGAFQQARMKSIREGKSYGIRLVLFENAPTVARQLWLSGSTVEYAVNAPDFRVRVVDGKIVPYYFNGTDWCWQETNWQDSTNIPRRMAKDFEHGITIQFDRCGRFFKMGADYTLAPPYDKLNLPDDDPASDDAMEYRISMTNNVLSWLPPTVMPRGMVVDLAFSGGGDETLADIPIAFSVWDDVVVVFSPVGNVDSLIVNGVPKKVNETLYFCVGEWDRQMDANGKTIAEDGKSNLQNPATYWVILHPKMGGIRIMENAPITTGSTEIKDQLYDARTFAREYFFDVGGY
jgi:type II secretory pathway pseudopilin PulG